MITILHMYVHAHYHCMSILTLAVQFIFSIRAISKGVTHISSRNALTVGTLHLTCPTLNCIYYTIRILYTSLVDITYYCSKDSSADHP